MLVLIVHRIFASFVVTENRRSPGFPCSYQRDSRRIFLVSLFVLKLTLHLLGQRRVHRRKRNRLVHRRVKSAIPLSVLAWDRSWRTSQARYIWPVRLKERRSRR